MQTRLALLTPTWSGDRTHFELLRASIEHSALKSLPHHVVVQTEDLKDFEKYNTGGIELIPTADVLPIEVEARRRKARQYQARAGRDLTRLLGSLARHLDWPQWVRYTGWHVQQITKLAFVAASTDDNTVILDSDVVVTRHARVDDFLHPEKTVCLEHLAPAQDASHKVRNWNRQACVLFGNAPPDSQKIDIYFDTPFVFYAPSVRAMLSWLEERYQSAWWDILLEQPPRRWSEFATYRTYLRSFVDQEYIDWRSDYLVRYLFDASDPQAVRCRFRELLQDPESHYITIHSQSSGRQLWGAEEYVPLILPLLSTT